MDNKQILPKDGYYTYTDYASWPEDVRYELIDGKAELMAAPGTGHQRISSRLHIALGKFLDGKPCEVFSAPFDVRLNADQGDDTVVQPDLLVICDKSKLDAQGCKGAPDLVVEILSPSTSSRDAVLKFNKYLQAGVREYWMVNPDSKTVSVHVLENGKYTAGAYGETDTVPSQVLVGCEIALGEVFG